MLTGIFGVVLAAIVALGWALDRRAAKRREDDMLTDGIFLGRALGKLSEEAKDAMFADVMASHHERTQSDVSDKDWKWYGIGTFAFCVACMVLSALVWMSM